MDSRWLLRYHRGEHVIYYDRKGRPYIVLDKGTWVERRKAIRGHSSILRRTVKFDSKGNFVYFGGCRFRPKGRTKSLVDMEVGMVSPFRECQIHNETVVHVGNRSEVWISL